MGRRTVMVLVAIVGVFAGPGLARGQGDVEALLRDAASRDFERARAAVEQLANHPGQRARTVPALIPLLATPEWDRCSAEVRQALATTLAGLKAKEAVGPLLELVKSGKPIEHECFQ